MKDLFKFKKIPETSKIFKLLRFELATINLIIVFYTSYFWLIRKEEALGVHSVLLIVTLLTTSVFEILIHCEIDKE
jgi:hypothetical protein